MSFLISSITNYSESEYFSPGPVTESIYAIDYGLCCYIYTQFKILSLPTFPSKNINLNLNLNLNSLLVKRQIDNPSPGAVTGGN